MPADDWEVSRPGTPVPNEEGKERKTELAWGETPSVLEDVAIRLEKAEDEGISKPREQRQEADDWLSEEHPVGATHDLGHILPLDLVILGRASHRLLRVCFAHRLSPSVQHDCGTGLRDEEEMDGLNDDTENELDPEVPSPGKELLNRATADTANHYGQISILTSSRNLENVPDPRQDHRLAQSTANCWSSEWNMSATIPRVTEPPAEQRPPRRRATRTMGQLVLAPARICQTLTKPSDNCITQKRPYSSDHGAQSSQPKPYRIKNQAMPALALVM